MGEWISVKDRRPEKQQQILCCGARGGMFAGIYKGGYCVNEEDIVACAAFDLFGNYGSGPRNFTHWMPLPAAPKEDE